MMKLPERMQNPGCNSDGYYRANINGKHRLVHNLVLEAFVGSRPKGMYACHNNGNPKDNRIENLRWDTPKNNVKDRNGHGTDQYGVKNPSAKYTDEQILGVYFSPLKASQKVEKYGVRLSTVYLIQCGVYQRLKHLLAQKGQSLADA